jgi:HD-GYP domain-containing protein (c-di-GMP phosphodiesterase class II)
VSRDKNISEVLSYIVSAVANCSLFSVEHPAVEEFSMKTLTRLEHILEKEPVMISLLSDSLIYNEAPLADTGTHINRLIKRLKMKGIERIVIEKGVNLTEIKKFIKALASMGNSISSTPHISIGVLEVKYRTDEDVMEIVNENLAKVEEFHEGISKFKQLDIRGVEDIVMGFVTALKKEANVLKSLSPIKDHSTYTFVHATNVSVLTLFQAEALGFSGEFLHDAGVAGLLHDVGKLFVPQEIIDKRGSLDDAEWNIMQQHPLHGALFLSGQTEVPKVAIIAAYEHHMKYDGTGYPKNKQGTQGQHILSQIVTLSDVFDALRTKRSYRSAFDLMKILEILKKDSGSHFNPTIYDNFLSAFHKVRAL